MNRLKTPTLLFAIGLLVLPHASRGQVPAPVNLPDVRKPLTVADSPATAPVTAPTTKADDTTKSPANLVAPATGNLIGLPLDKLAKPDRPERSESAKTPVSLTSADEIKRLIDQFNDARSAFLEEERELRRKFTSAGRDEREKLRELIKEKRQAFLDEQKDAREELRKRTTELKDQLKDHRGILDAAKDQARDDVKRRKGGRD